MAETRWKDALESGAGHLLVDENTTVHEALVFASDALKVGKTLTAAWLLRWARKRATSMGCPKTKRWVLANIEPSADAALESVESAIITVHAWGVSVAAMMQVRIAEAHLRELWLQGQRSAAPWSPSFSDDEEPTAEGAIVQAIGTASMCWKPEPAGVFDAETAEWVHRGLMDFLEEKGFLAEMDDKEHYEIWEKLRTWREEFRTRFIEQGHAIDELRAEVQALSGQHLSERPERWSSVLTRIDFEDPDCVRMVWEVVVGDGSVMAATNHVLARAKSQLRSMGRDGWEVSVSDVSWDADLVESPGRTYLKESPVVSVEVVARNLTRGADR